MHDIWNPWHGCIKCSEGCQNCYMYTLDRMRGQDGRCIRRVKSGFDYPLQRDRAGHYRVRSGETLRVCMTSDFFLEEADAWRPAAWDIIRQRRDIRFYLLTKRPQRVAQCLPPDWGDGWEQVMFNVTCENQARADERLPLLLSLPFRHKGVMCAPLIGPVSMDAALATGQIEQVLCGGENYDGSRPCRFEWVQRLQSECVRQDVTFGFLETGTVFDKGGKRYLLPDKQLQARMAGRSGMNYQGRKAVYHFRDAYGEISSERLYVPRYDGPHCAECGGRLSCNGCSHCGKCR